MDFNNMNIIDLGGAGKLGAVGKKAVPKKKHEAAEAAAADSVELGAADTSKKSDKAAANKKKKPHAKKEEAAPAQQEEVKTEPKKKPKTEAAKEEIQGKSKEGVELKFIHINDFHGYVEELEKPEQGGIIGGIARIAGEVKALKSENPNGAILLDGGDIFEGGFYSKYTKGEIVSKPIASMGFDATVIGNHDVIWGVDIYANIALGMNTDVLGAANLIDISQDSQLKFLKPYKVMERNGVKIGILGLTSPMTSLSTPQKGTVEIQNPKQAAEKFVKKLRDEEKVDMVVLLSHLGHDEDVKLAEKVKGIDLIVGAHSHTVMKDAEKVGDTIIVQAGGEGKYVGDLNLVFDPVSKKIVTYKENLIPVTAKIKPDPEVQKIIAPYIEKFDKIKNEKVGKTSEDLDLVPNKHGKLCNLFVDTQKQDSDLAVSSMFSLRKGIEKGDVTVGKLFQMYPFDNELVQVKAKGENVLKYLERGLSFVEGGKDNYALVSGLTYDYNPALVEGSRITSVTLNGEEMTPQEFAKKNITISMDTYTYGKSYFKEGKLVKKYGRVFDILKDYIKENSPLKGISGDSGSKEVSTVADPDLLSGLKLGKITKDPETSTSGNTFSCGSKFYGDAIKGDSDIAFGYNKSIASSLPEGDIDKGVMKKFYYHDNELYKIKASGAQVLEFLERARDDKNLGKEQILSSGITYKYDTSQPNGKRIVSVTVGDKTYNREELLKQTFTLSVDDFLYDAKFKAAEILEQKGPVINILGDYLKNNSPLHVPLQPSPGTDINSAPPITTDPAKQEERMKKLVALGAGKIKPDEVNEFSLSKVTITVDAADSLKAKKEMIAGAKECVGVTMYTLTMDDMINSLIQKAQEKVPVRVVMDPHIHTTPEKLLERAESQQKLLKGGVRFMEDPGDNIFCNHSKTTVVDHKKASVDKINWADYSDEYHDYGCTIEGGRAVNDVENFFNTVWNMSGGKALAPSAQNPDVEGGVPIKVSITNPDSSGRNTPFNNIITNLSETAKTVKGQYFSLTSVPIVNRLIEVKEKDPDRQVKILLNESIFLENGNAQKLAQKMIDKGIEVRLYKDEKGKLNTLHSAATTFDGREASFGSANTTFGGLFSNREANVNIVGQDNVKPMETQFDYDWEKNSREIKPDDMKMATKAAGEDEEKAKPYYDVPIEQIGKALSIDVKKLNAAIEKIYDTVGFEKFKDNQALEIKLVVQKLASMAYKDNKAFDTIMNKFVKLLTQQVSNMKEPEKENKKAALQVKNIRETLAEYIVINNIVANDPKADRDDLVNKMITISKAMADPSGVVDNTRLIISAFADKYGIS